MLTTVQVSALAELRSRGTLRPSSRAFSPYDGRRLFARRTLQALVDAGYAQWRLSVRGTRQGPVTYNGFVEPVEKTSRYLAVPFEPTREPASFKTGYLDNALDSLDTVLATAERHLRDVDFDTLVGTGFSGALVVPSLAMRLGKQFVLVRKDNDDSHHSGQMIGNLGNRWIFVDDFVSSGRTRQRVIDAIKAGSRRKNHRTTHVGGYYYADHIERKYVQEEEDF